MWLAKGWRWGASERRRDAGMEGFVDEPFARVSPPVPLPPFARCRCCCVCL